jgi:hypothetical protein
VIVVDNAARLASTFGRATGKVAFDRDLFLARSTAISAIGSKAKLISSGMDTKNIAALVTFDSDSHPPITKICLSLNVAANWTK